MCVGGGGGGRAHQSAVGTLKLEGEHWFGNMLPIYIKTIVLTPYKQKIITH